MNQTGKKDQQKCGLQTENKSKCIIPGAVRLGLAVRAGFIVTTEKKVQQGCIRHNKSHLP